ncbi:MAG: hypothetical protein ACRD9Q_00105 [Nitrososphaeraceae archaeon]
MESIGIIEMMGWYVVGFSVTLGSLHLISRLNIVRKGAKKTIYLKPSFDINTKNALR